jgi:hypothetical protein
VLIVIGAAIACAIGFIFLYRSWQLAQYGEEFRPLLTRAASLMDGIADPPANEDSDGALYNHDRFEPSDITGEASAKTERMELTSAEVNGDDAALHVDFIIHYYDADDVEIGHLGCNIEVWHARRQDDGSWAVYSMMRRSDSDQGGKRRGLLLRQYGSKVRYFIV